MCFGYGGGQLDVQTGLRVDGFVLDGFKELCRENVGWGCSMFDGGLLTGLFTVQPIRRLWLCFRRLGMKS